MRGFVLSGEFEVGDLVAEIFQIVAHHERGVIRVRPRTDAGQGNSGCFERPFDGISENRIRIHARRPASMADERLHRGAINEIAFAVRLNRDGWIGVAPGQDSRICCLDLPNAVGKRWRRGGVRRESPRGFFGGGGQTPGQEARGNVADDAVVSRFGKCVIQTPVPKGGRDLVQPESVGDGEIAARSTVGIASK